MKTSMMKQMRTMKMKVPKINSKHISITVLALETITYLLKVGKKLAGTIK